MMVKALKLNRGLVLGVTAQFLQYGAALLLLPFIVVRLSAEEVGIWYVFMAVQGLAMLMDFGFQSTFARNFALAFSGAKELIKEGLADGKHETANYELVARVLYIARLIYASVSLVVLVVLLTLGSLYVLNLAESAPLSKDSVLLAWLMFAVALSINLYFMWISPLLIGADKVEQNYLYLIVNRVVFVLGGVILLELDFGLLGLALSFLLGVMTARYVAGYFIRPINRLLVKSNTTCFDAAKKDLQTVWHNASRMGLVSLGAFLIIRSNVFIVSHFMGLVAAASYGMTIQLYMGLSSVAQMIFQVNIPKMVKARVECDIKKLRAIVYSSTIFYFVLFFAGAVVIILFGSMALDFIGSEAELLNVELMTLLAVIFLLEGNHSNCALTITTGNKVPFVYPALISGFAIFTLSTMSASLGFGLLGIIASQGGVQLAYNNWKWPWLVYGELNQNTVSAKD